MWLRADVSQEDEMMSREDCAVSARGPVWARVWVLQFTGSAEITNRFTYWGNKHVEVPLGQNLGSIGD